MYDLRISNGLIVTGQEIIKADLYVQNSKVAYISLEPMEAYQTYDANGLYILPGCLDTHVHFRDPGHTHKEDFEHATRAAAVGGMTTVLEMPNTNPPTTDVANMQAKIAGLEPKAYVDYGLWGLCLGEANINDLTNLQNAGTVAFKFFWGYAFDKRNFQLVYNYKPAMTGIIPPLDNGEVYELFEAVGQLGAIIAIHAEDHALVQRMTARVKRSGQRDYEALLMARPNLAEELTVQTAISFSKATGAKLHILHMSTAEGVELVRQAQQRGIQVTAETCPHYLFLDADDYDRVGPAMKVYPPIKRKSDREALWSGLRDGVISVVSSDHAPHTLEEKKGDLFTIPSGMCGVETALPLMLNEVNEGRLALPFVVKVLAENPAKLFNLYPRKGSLNIGADADMVVVDMTKSSTILNEKLHSKQPFTAFDNTLVRGWPVATFLRGQQIVQDGEVIAPPKGLFIRPN